MNTICTLSEFEEKVSVLTGRTIYVNQAPELYLVSPAADPAAVAIVAQQWLNDIEAVKPEHRPTAGCIRAVKHLATANSREEIALALDRILLTEFMDLVSTTTAARSQRFLVQLMLSLWCAGVIAWPAKVQEPFSMPSLRIDNPGFREPQLPWLTSLHDLLKRGSTDDSNNFRFILDSALSRAGVLDIGDLTPDTFQMNPDHVRTRKLRAVGITAVLQCLRENYPDRKLVWTPEDFGFFKAQMGRLTRDDDFQWILRKDPELKHWVQLAKEHIATNPPNWKKRKSAINVFLSHLLDNRTLSRNPAEYFDIHKRPTILFNVPGNKGRGTMTVVYEFLEEALGKTCSLTDDNELPMLMPGFSVPLARPSYKGVNKGETHRETMPTRLIRQAMNILTENDFAWAKEVGRVSDSFRWRNPESGEVETVWSPVRAFALLIKLLLPARTFQVRHLDSGEGDTLRRGTDGSWTPNTGPHCPEAPPTPVEHGVFRKYRRKDGTDGTVLYFNTNKTADIDSDTKGYVMPWEKMDAIQIFAEMRDWQEHFNPVGRPTAWTEIQELIPVKHADDLAKMGESYFLFRDPCHRSRPDLPVTDVRIRNLWLKLMEELERRLAAANEILPNGEPIRLIRQRDTYGAASSAVFDLHTLRVTIITAMYEEGMPPEILMKIVGHASVLMTLYYIKLNIEAVSMRMDEAMRERQKKAQSEMAGFLQRASREELEHAVAYRSTSALDAVAGSSGTGMVVMDHGICPVACRRCHEGLAVIDHSNGMVRNQPVPGGPSNCTRCRFFISGPAFLFGLEAKVGDLAYRLKKASFTFEKAQTRFDALSDQFAAALETGTPFSEQRNLEIAESSLEGATAEVDGIALSLQATFGLTEQCLEIINHHDTKSGVALVALGGVDQVEAVLSECHEFEQLHRICMDATFFDGLNIDWQRPNLERARMFDRILRNAGHDARFSLLDDDDALSIANAMGQFLYSRLDKDTVHALVDGRTTLRAVGMDKAFIAQIESMEPKSLSPAVHQKLLEVEA